jgi:hypothetical protein
MVVAIVLIVTIGKVVSSRYRRRHDDVNDGNDDVAPRNDGAVRVENRHLQEEMRGLKERIAVLERVITDNESGARIDREIDRLRDPNRV